MTSVKMDVAFVNMMALLLCLFSEPDYFVDDFLSCKEAVDNTVLLVSSTLF